MSGKREKQKRREQAALAAAHPHKWGMLVGFKIDDMTARRAHEEPDDIVVLLDMHNVIQPGEPDEDYAKVQPNIGCIACEQPWALVNGQPCPGQPPGHLSYVGDDGRITVL